MKITSDNMDIVLCLNCGEEVIPEYVEFDHAQVDMFPDTAPQPHDPYWKTKCEACGESGVSEFHPDTLADLCGGTNVVQRYEDVNLGAFMSRAYQEIATYVYRLNRGRH